MGFSDKSVKLEGGVITFSTTGSKQEFSLATLLPL